MFKHSIVINSNAIGALGIHQVVWSVGRLSSWVMDEMESTGQYGRRAKYRLLFAREFFTVKAPTYLRQWLSMCFAVFIVANVTNAVNRSSESFCQVDEERGNREDWGWQQDMKVDIYSNDIIWPVILTTLWLRVLVAFLVGILTDWPTRNDCYLRQKNTRAFGSDWSQQRRADCSYFMRKWDYLRFFEKSSSGWQFEGSDFKGEFPWLLFHHS